MALEKRADYKNLDQELDMIFGRLLRNMNWKFVISLFGALVAGVIGWTTLSGQVDNNGKSIERVKTLHIQETREIKDELKNRSEKINSIDITKNDIKHLQNEVGKINNKLDNQMHRQIIMQEELLKEIRKR